MININDKYWLRNDKYWFDTDVIAWVILILMSLLISACNGGGDGSANSSSSSDDDIPPATKLMPLSITTRDMNDNAMPYVDISAIGIHTIYKLRFTNPNNVTVTIPTYNLPSGTTYYINTSFSDQNWKYAQEEMYGESYLDQYNPGMGAISGYFIKTINSDDCFNMSSIPALGYCSYYAYAYNTGMSNAQSNTFSYPLAYFIETLDHKLYLTVQQCNYEAWHIRSQYNCANESAPGYANQFISYKINPINGNTNILIDTYLHYGYAVSHDGNWAYNCTSAVCNKYSLDYDSVSNSLTQSAVADDTINLPFEFGSSNINTIYPSIDGSQAWVSSYDAVNGYRVLNTQSPTIIFTEACVGGNPCIPDINSLPSGFIPGVRGLDNSFWWNTQTNADRYVPLQNTFVKTNVPSLGGVNPDGVIVAGNITPACYYQGAEYTTYTSKNISNYITPPSGVQYSTSNQYTYLKMLIPGLYDGNGNRVNLYGYYRIHTEGSLCEVESDDYVTNVPYATAQYQLSFPDGYTYLAVAPISSFYQGK